MTCLSLTSSLNIFGEKVHIMHVFEVINGDFKFLLFHIISNEIKYKITKRREKYTILMPIVLNYCSKSVYFHYVYRVYDTSIVKVPLS